MLPRDLNGPAAHVLPEQGWFKSSYTGPNGGDCVEVNQQLSDVVGVRDSKQPDGGALVVDRSCWRSFLAAVVGDGMTPGA